MDKFNGFVEYLLEGDTSDGSTGRHVVQSLINDMREIGNEPLADALEERILKNPKYENILNVPPDSPSRLAQLRSMINEVVSILGIEDSSVDDDSDYKKDLKPGYFGREIGRKRGDFIKHGPLERSFRDTMFDFRQGNLLKKLGMIGRGIGNVVLPTSSLSTGVFK